MSITVGALFDIIAERIRKDKLAAAAFVDGRATRIAHVTLDSLANNIALELIGREPVGMGDTAKRFVEACGPIYAKPHDSGSAPPKGFTRYQIEIDVPDEIDSSNLLERAQELAGELIEEAERGEINGGEDDEHEAIEALGDRIANRVSVQPMGAR